MTLGSGSAGKGITSDNVSPMNLIYVRKVGYGVRQIKDIGMGILGGDQPAQAEKTKDSDSDSLYMLQQILEQALKSMK